MPRPRPEPLRNTGSQRPLDTRAILDTFRPDGPFAEAFPHYEHRPQQMDMLESVAEAFNKDETLLVEAGTGTGKSVAYTEIFIMRFVNGRIAEIWGVADVLAQMKQLGMIQT